MTIKDKIAQYKEELDMFPDSIEKYQYLIEKGKNALNPNPNQLKTDDWKVHGCMSPSLVSPQE